MDSKIGQVFGLIPMNFTYFHLSQEAIAKAVCGSILSPPKARDWLVGNELKVLGGKIAYEPLNFSEKGQHHSMLVLRSSSSLPSSE